MIIITIKTNEPQAQLGLYQDQELLEEINWEGHRQLAETIHQKLADLLAKHAKDWSDITGLVCYKGPGSFTGLRIGMSLANALAYGVHAAVVGQNGDAWVQHGIDRLLAGEDESTALPEYGGEIHITQPRK